MNLNDIIEKERAIQRNILDYLDNEAEFDDLIKKLKEYQITKNRNEFKNILYLILNISNNHHRFPLFFNKIEKIIQFYKTDISNAFTNSEIFNIFKSNKLVLLLLFEEKILIKDEFIIDFFYKYNYYAYFKHINSEESNRNDSNQNFKKEKKTDEINSNKIDINIEESIERISNDVNSHDKINIKWYIDSQLELLSQFNLGTIVIEDENEISIKRKNGENDNLICKIIREDSIVDFIKYINETNLPLTSTIKSSIYETNPLLLKKEPTLIEYSAFFGSIQILQYLVNNKVKMNSELWIYAIHSRNPEIINYLEENKINPHKKSVKESIKCFHNEITEYLLDNYSNEFDKNFLYQSVKYYNFEYFPNFQMNKDLLFYYLCGSDNYYFVEFLLNNANININYKIKSKLESYDEQIFYFQEYPNLSIYATSINAAAKKMNYDILSLLFKQKNIEIIDFCFYGCRKITKISIPSSVKSIGNFAFFNCDSLEEINFDSFKNTSSIEKFGIGAFKYCLSLKQITIPSSVKLICNEAFYECVILKQITIPDSVTLIGNEAFYECKLLEQITIPTSVTSIGNGAFRSCSSLKQITIPDSVTSIGNEAFRSCSSLEQIIIPESVSLIGSGAFFQCKSLVNIVIPFSVFSINKDAFSECSSLKQIKIP